MRTIVLGLVVATIGILSTGCGTKEDNKNTNLPTAPPVMPSGMDRVQPQSDKASGKDTPSPTEAKK